MPNPQFVLGTRREGVRDPCPCLADKPDRAVRQANFIPARHAGDERQALTLPEPAALVALGIWLGSHVDKRRDPFGRHNSFVGLGDQDAGVREREGDEKRQSDEDYAVHRASRQWACGPAGIIVPRAKLGGLFFLGRLG
jgi:hypothetical protein